jgi:sterol O-acyltransferase
VSLHLTLQFRQIRFGILAAFEEQWDCPPPPTLDISLPYYYSTSLEPSMTPKKPCHSSDSVVSGVRDDEQFIVTKLPELLRSTSGQINLDNSLLSAFEQHADDWSGEPSSSMTSEEEEDYDDLKPNPETIVSGGRGGGMGKDESINGKQIDSFAKRVPRIPSDERAFESLRYPTPGSKTNTVNRRRRRSIQVVLEKTGKKGRYILTADDPEFREILKSHLDREASALDPSKKQRTRFRDLVFTRQFTTFDRQNPLSSESPFHGFFTLFWIGMGLLLTKVAALNWRSTGSVLGNAEILHMMTDRDLVVLGLTDGIMCLGTLFGLGLQKLILNGYLSWNKSGWIIQNLWQTFYLFAVIAWTMYRDWPWTHTVFIVLHVLVFVMKQHSYAFYNGYRESIYYLTSLLFLTA